MRQWRATIFINKYIQDKSTQEITYAAPIFLYANVGCPCDALSPFPSIPMNYRILHTARGHWRRQHFFSKKFYVYNTEQIYNIPQLFRLYDTVYTKKERKTKKEKSHRASLRVKPFDDDCVHNKKL